ncbi:hypothetical protein TWF225_006768 [Orbilia oligospora]|uniref:Uncharacterized protein n=1 Tax=Orbilia oligospora TaxID=2813651 RepID=A0A7C8K7P8_ORBOL|nr:hypothetical protein TWF751_009713 [Orbilia oligospora]KAF3181223.1 hypothetical protein TWF225_006768 [Orbilia oligospora]KAF3242896.1 hypothetical protein TWF128_010363 [Orbilia oligospora]KAF3260343.1 hypothetical protein TWF217_004916 [Orbilia oligospora]KAF3278139.1 hypothetical protein TWF132_001250 [Orbilia oligospora]
MPPKPRRPPKPRGGAAAASSSTAAEDSHKQEEFEPSSTAAESSTSGPSEPIESIPLAIPPPSGRLEGLNNPAAPNLRSTRATTVSTVAEASGSTATVQPPILAPGERPKPKLKFAPKNTIRKTKEEREQLNRQYDPPPQSDSLNAFGVTRGGPSGRGARGRGRGRGGFGRGDGGPKREEVAVASGPFSMGSVITMGGKQKVSIERLSRSFRTNRVSGLKTKREIGEDGEVKDEPYSSSDSEGGPKVDVEMIEMISSDEEEDGEGGEKKYSSVRGFAPVRIERREHVDKLAQQGGGKEEKGKKDVKGKGKEVDLEILEERRARSGRRDSGTGPRVKIEPSESPKATRRTTRSPEQIKKKQSSSPEDRRRKQVARSRSGNRKKDIIVPQSQEDFEEIDRYEVDRFSMLNELGPALPGRGVDAEGDHDMDDATAIPPEPRPDEKQNKLYLFQFPPVLPLMEPIEDVEDAEAQVKEEDSTAPAAASSSNQPAIKKEEKPKPKYISLAEVQKAQLPPGTAGKLNVHRSGKVTMVFGGIEFEVQRGVECDFLQDIVVLQKDSGALDERGKPKGRAWGMGQLKGKFVVTPDISKLV